MYAPFRKMTAGGMSMKSNIKKLLIYLAIPLAVGGLSALFSGGMSDYASLNQPPLSTPGWVFPGVWTIL